MKTRFLYKRLRTFAAVSLLLWTPMTAQATDVAVLRLGTLIDQADVIVIGTAKEVSEDKASGSQKAAITIQETLRGKAPAALTLAGSTTDPTLHNFSVGVQFLGFLKATAKGFTPVGDLHGLIEIPPGRLPATSAIIKEWLTKRTDIRLADLRDDVVVQKSPAASVLIGSMLEEMAARLTAVDGPLVTEMACNQKQEFPSAIQVWAIHRVGPLKVGDARSCVETLLTAKDQSAASLAAAETLGNLKDPRSLPALTSVLTTQDQTSEDINDDADGGLSLAVILAMGKIGDSSAVSTLLKIAQNGEDLALHSTVVHALGLIGPKSIDALTDISKNHPNQLIRAQAQRTLERVQKA
jgi:hypothetical protein